MEFKTRGSGEHHASVVLLVRRLDNLCIMCGRKQSFMNLSNVCFHPTMRTQARAERERARERSFIDNQESEREGERERERERERREREKREERREEQ
jgi:hypothetical protein